MNFYETPTEEQRRKRDDMLYADWLSLTADPRKRRTRILENLQNKYKLRSCSAVYNAIKRAKARAENGE
jgi:hypothetical protein